jgi:hypothetical protein
MDPVKLRNELTGTWLRSFEEETSGEYVFRSRGFAFPRTRAPRSELRLRADGTVVALGAGPTDRLEVRPGLGEWSVRGSTLSLRTPPLTGEFTLEVIEPDRLVLRREPDEID